MSKLDEAKLNMAFWGMVILFAVSPRPDISHLQWMDKSVVVGGTLFFAIYVVRFTYLLLSGKGEA